MSEEGILVSSSNIAAPSYPTWSHVLYRQRRDKETIGESANYIIDNDGN